MKQWIIILLLALSPTVLGGLKLDKIITVKRIEPRADFLIAYEKIRINEGGFSNLKDDKGGPTYAGITYKWNPDWYGWRYVSLNSKQNQHYSEAECHVLDFYLTIWVREGFYKLRNQQVANYLFDTRVNIPASRINKNIFDELKLDVTVKYNEEWVTPELDYIDLKQLKRARIRYYHYLVNKNATQQKFIKSWLRRATDIS